MPAVRIRQPFLAAFIVLGLAAGYLGLSAVQIPTPYQSDKGLHFVTFFLLTIAFYWILETSRRRCINLTLLVCVGGLSIGSEFVQAIIPDNGREFDPFDIAANIAGSGLALFLCSWYHKRMLERRRKNKHYDIVPGEEAGEEDDVELGLVPEQEAGSLPLEANGDVTAGAAQKPNVTEELDNWDENAEDWEEPGEGNADLKKTEDEDDAKKRSD